MNIKFNSLFTGINEHIKKKAMVFYGPNIGKIDDCINSVVSSGPTLPSPSVSDLFSSINTSFFGFSIMLHVDNLHI
mgnify:CR=1 FL=1